MIQCRLRELIASRSREIRRKVTYEDVRASTGLSKTTLVKLANDRAGLISINTLNRLCWYFDCQPGDLLIYVPDSEQGDAKDLSD
ncbi:helix-turn-helix domain-containing protein [Chloroflexota bacterium]